MSAGEKKTSELLDKKQKENKRLKKIAYNINSEDKSV